MKTSKFFLLLFAAAIPVFASAQVTFQKGYSFQASYSSFRTVKSTSDGGYIFGGGPLYYYSGSAFLLKTNALGDTSWTRSFDDSLNLFNGSYADVVLQTFDGGFFAAGYAKYSSIETDIYLIRTDNNGDSLWTRTLSHPAGANDFCYDAIQTSDTNFVTIGVRTITEPDLCLIKWSHDGNLLWSKSFSLPGYGLIGNFIYETSDNGLILGGNTNGITCKAILIKTDSAGDIQWAKMYGNIGVTKFNSVLQTDGGGYLIEGNSENFGAGYKNILLIKTDGNGDTLWTRTFGETGAQVDCISMKKTSDHGYILGGTYQNPNNALKDMCMVKIDSSGNFNWSRRYGYIPWDDEGYEAAEGSDGGFVLCGYTVGPIHTANIVKTDNSGNSGCNESILSFSTGFAPFQVNPISPDTAGISLVGYPKTYVRRGAIETQLCYDRINESLNSSMISIYPNPSTGYFTVNTGTFTSSMLKMTVTDLVGRINLTRNINLPLTEFNVDLHALPNGIYLVRLEDSACIYMSKVIISR